MGKYKRHLKYISLILFVFLAVFTFYAFGGHLILREYLTREYQRDLKFSFSSCNEDKLTPAQRVVEQGWEGNTLTVKGVVSPNCATTWLFGSYSTMGDNQLNLEYKPILSGLMACTCDYEVNYEISGLTQQDFDIKFIQLPEDVVGH